MANFRVLFTSIRHSPDVIEVALLNPFGETLDSHRLNKDQLLEVLDNLGEFTINFQALKVRR